MDAPRARAATVLEEITATCDPRARKDTSMVNALSLFCVRYNSTSSNVITVTPTTALDHRNVFFAALDVVCAALGINFQAPLQDYSYNPQVISILAREELPYSVNAIKNVIKIRTGPGAGCNTTRFYHPYAIVQAMTPGGLFLRAEGNRPMFTVTSTTQIETSLLPGEVLNPMQFIFPQGADNTSATFVWHPVMYGIVNGGVNEETNNLTVNVSNVDVRPGVAFTLAPASTVWVRNNSPNQDAVCRFSCLEYFRTVTGWDVYPEMKSDLAMVYSYHDESWHELRSYLCGEMGLPRHRAPPRVMNQADQVLAIYLIARLCECYLSHRPALTFIFQLPNRQGNNRAQAFNRMAAI
uniref:Core protein VP7 n=1 Tax=Skunk River virus TaxID=2488682 RepID=A0A3Q8RRR6_9REOV|nr:VP7 [Skunk River virus]